MVPEVKIGKRVLHSVKLDRRRLNETDLVLILAAQRDVDWEMIINHAKHAFDACNALGRPTGGNITRL